MRLQRSAAAILCIALLFTACGGGFAQTLRSILNASGPMIDGLPISPSLKSGLVVDFKDLAQGAANLKDDLDACKTPACKLDAVNRLQRTFWDVQRRNHFGQHPKLERIEAILRGIIESARIFYGAPVINRRGPGGRPKSLKEQLKDLEREMK